MQELLCSHVRDQAVFFSPYSMAAAWAAKHPGSWALQVHAKVGGGGGCGSRHLCLHQSPPPPSQGLQLTPPRAFVTFLPGCQSALQVSVCTQMSSSPTQEVIQWILRMNLRIPGLPFPIQICSPPPNFVGSTFTSPLPSDPISVHHQLRWSPMVTEAIEILASHSLPYCF